MMQALMHRRYDTAMRLSTAPRKWIWTEFDQGAGLALSRGTHGYV